MMFLILILLIAFLYYNSDNGSFSFIQKRSKVAEELLKEKYINGEIDEKTYLKMKETLMRR